MRGAGMTAPAQDDIDNFVNGSAQMLGIELDEQARKPVCEVLRGLAIQIALVLDSPIRNQP